MTEETCIVTYQFPHWIPDLNTREVVVEEKKLFSTEKKMVNECGTSTRNFLVPYLKQVEEMGLTGEVTMKRFGGKGSQSYRKRLIFKDLENRDQVEPILLNVFGAQIVEEKYKPAS